mgnify:CR=1 FL=1
MELEKTFNLLEEKITKYNRKFDKEFLPTSALSLLRTYNNKNQKDLELWGFICATVDYQINVINRLIPMMTGLINELDRRHLHYIDLTNNPDEASEILTNFDWGDNNSGFKHRFLKVKDLLVINKRLQNILDKYGSLGKYVEFLYDMALEQNQKYPMRFVLKNLTQKLRANLPPDFCKSAIPDFEKGSAMKRLCLFFRWMVRPYPDLHLWPFFSTEHLLPPIDSSIKRAFRRIFKINLKRSTNFKDVLKIYEILKQINEQDPIKYDFALSRPSLAGYCAKDPKKNQCYYCPFIGICESSQGLAEGILDGRPILSEYERDLFEQFLRLRRNEFDEIKTEVSLGRKQVDALCHVKRDGWWIIEVERELNYTSVGQALVYKRLYDESFKNQQGQAVIVCGKDDKDIARMCELDAGIKVFVLKS